MNKYLPLILLTFLFFFGCGSSQDDKNQNSQTTQFSIQSGISSGDIFSIAQKVRLEFSSPLDTSTVNSSTVYLEELTSSEGVLVGSYTGVTDGTNSIYLTPYSYLKPSSTYQITVTTGVKDIQERSLSSDYVFSFTTAADEVDSSSFDIRSFKPDSDATDIFTNTDIVVDFSASLSQEAGYMENSNFNVFYTDANGTITNNVEGRVEVFNSLLKFIPTVAFPNDVNVTVELISDVKNLYGTSTSLEGTQWSFQTIAQNTNSEGYYNLSSLQTGKNSYYMSKYGSRFVVARDGGIDLYTISYVNHIPVFSKLSSLVISEPITSIEMSATHILVSTRTNGIEVIELNPDTNSMSLKGKYLEGNTIYKARFGETNSSKVYAVGPTYGFEIFSFIPETGLLSSLTHMDSNIVGVALDVVDIISIDLQGASQEKIYIADYDGGVVILDQNDTNGSSKIYIDLNTSIRNLLVTQGYSTVVSSISSFGGVQAIDENGLVPGPQISFPQSVQDVSSYSDPDNGIFFNMYASNEDGIFIEAEGYIGSNIKTDGRVLSCAYIDGEFDPFISGNFTEGFIVAINSDGKIQIYNISSDQQGPNRNDFFNPAIAVDSNISISLGDQYLDYSSIVESQFTFVDTNGTNIPFIFNETPGGSVLLNPVSELSADHNYTLTLKASIVDIFGNALNAGIDKTYLYQVGK